MSSDCLRSKEEGRTEPRVEKIDLKTFKVDTNISIDERYGRDLFKEIHRFKKI